ncbi:hypothetical protein JO972_07620 [Verrucomicrobiaceae bacterium 5K15]|uniref:SLA1 homology domain-containing protein n=1 Tax=Oceaniferula flava TaxID=2800421 RepID=A0AAE2SAI4_9BACT|nr:SHD1 domain-containing protein [Oceaniferula flavus]MBK1854823.1 hypothetical protein [Oceaniferula flavus]MBM1136129.1 hypothetical protein [Oceaniferula flavus]
MKMFVSFCCLLLQISFAIAAEPTELRTWQATSGHKVQAKATQVDEGTVHLEKEDGKVVRVPLAKFVAADQERLKKHFEISDEPALADGSGAKAAEGLPHPVGEITGPVQAGTNSSYYVYLPKSLKQGRKAPLLFYTNSINGNGKWIQELTEYAELFGWVVAISVESCNKAGYEKSKASCKLALEHIMATLPVDDERIHYTGNSGGGAVAFLNSETMAAYGILPNTSYALESVKVRTTVVYALGGGYDYNRYLTADAAERYKKDGFHRMTKLSHNRAPADHRGDGMFWMHCKYLGDAKKDHQEEAKDFEISTLEWLATLKQDNPKRAYSNAIVFQEIYQPEGSNGRALEQLIKELAEDKDNVLYHEALLAIDKFSGKYYAPLGEDAGSEMGHKPPKRVVSAVEKLQLSYGHIPEINEVLEAMKKVTVKK